MHKAHGGTGGAKILVNPDEITTIYNYLQEILTELKTNAEPNIQKLSNLDFYTDGKAMEVMKVYHEANEKVMDLSDQYIRASSLVIDILNTMMKADNEIAQQIIAKLEV
ncbi:hypothetical protein HHO41_14910 [Bacillus sp. DNRA2]|uniref:hypothetical protein n=1 Tax=Bacillus sp. DNRA2 TaxID=2723053 RepID=UPI00145F10EF|nr:hypothetical protein [Bacillus sp. DNRA2]NMD71591.1 hypothetical protein [Bacillus sp. DNRA2]